MRSTANTELAKIIRAAGIRVTKPRLLVLAFLQGALSPVGIREIMTASGCKQVDQVTVYRILDVFKKAGLVTQVDFQHGRAYYEMKDVRRDHHHIICTSCAHVEDFTGCNYNTLVPKALRQTEEFAKITSHSFELFGLCNTCFKSNLTAV